MQRKSSVIAKHRSNRYSTTTEHRSPYQKGYSTFWLLTKYLVCSYFPLVSPELNPNLHFICGISAGLLASVITQPADVIKTQLQLYPFRYKSTLDCVFVVCEKNGVQGLFRGMLPRCMRRTLMAAMSWTVFEAVMKRLGLKV